MEPSVGEELCRLFPGDEHVDLARILRHRKNDKKRGGSPRLESASRLRITSHGCTSHLLAYIVFLTGYHHYIATGSTARRQPRSCLVLCSCEIMLGDSGNVQDSVLSKRENLFLNKELKNVLLYGSSCMMSNLLPPCFIPYSFASGVQEQCSITNTSYRTKILTS